MPRLNSLLACNVAMLRSTTGRSKSKKRWQESIHPRAQPRRLTTGLDGGANEPDTVELPAPYQQPHRLRYQLTSRGGEHTLRIGRDLEPRIDQRFGVLPNTGFVWSNVNNELLDYSPTTGLAHQQTVYVGNRLDAHVRSFRWSCGIGYGKWIRTVNMIDVRDASVVAFGVMRLLRDDETRFTIHVDSDWIVRKAILSIPSRDGGNDEYVILTQGTRRPDEAPTLASSGHFRRIVRPAGRKFKILDDYQVAFVGLSGQLTDEEYASATEIKIPESATMIDMRSVLPK